MKAAPFEYSRAGDVDEACALLAADDGARAIAGGQTLVPMMAMRLARPTRLVDIARIAALSHITKEDGMITIGAATRQCVIERDALTASELPLMARAIPNVGHSATRARGTLGGSLAHADPAAELPLVAVTLDAAVHYREGKEASEMPAGEFFIGPTITALPAHALLTSVRFPVWTGRVGAGFHEVNARRSDFAFASAAAQVELDNAGKAKRVAIGVGAVTDVPVRLDTAEAQLTGGTLDEKTVRAAVTEALADIEALEDLHASAAYRRRAAVSLTVRAIADAKSHALANAQGRTPHAH